MPDNNTPKVEHVIKLFTVSKEQPVRIIYLGREINQPDVQLPAGIYEKTPDNSFLFRGQISLFQDGNLYNLFRMPDNSTIYGDLDLSGLGLTELPDLSKTMIMGTFNCSYNFLKNLRGSPKYAKGYNCSANLELTSLLGATSTVNIFDCSVCPRLYSLEHIPYAKTYSINGNPQLSSFANKKEQLNARLFDVLPDEFDVLNVQDGPAHINIGGKKIGVIDVSYNFRRTDLKDMPANADCIIYDHCANLAEDAITEYNRRRRTYLDLQRQTEIEFQ